MQWNWMGVVVLAAGVGVAAGQGEKPMATDAHPGFEVAAIKLTPPESNNQGIQSDGHRLNLKGETVKSVMMFVYGVQGKQILGEPAWADEEKYDEQGVLDTEGEPDVKQMQEALGKLLADRFGLKIHKEKREMSYFALRVALGGPKLEKSKTPDAQPDQTGNGGAKGMNMKFTANTMDDFTLGMNYFTDRPVVNETGLTGRWDFTLKWTPDEMKAGDLPADAAPGMFTAIKDELGLKLEPAKGPVEVLVVDAVERPTAN